MTKEDCLNVLTELGFSRLEAEVYVFLLEESPATGYRVAQAIGKPTANTYKAVESLQHKGAVIVDEGASRLCRALPADELLARVERRFLEQKAKASQALAELGTPAGDDGIYHLTTCGQVFERCRRMLDAAETVAVLDVFPDVVETIRPDIERAVNRGVKVAVKTYRPIEIAGVEVVCDPRGEAVFERWPGQWLNLVTDGRELLLSFLTADGKNVLQAVWSGSPYLAWVYHGGGASELILDALLQRIRAGVPTDELRIVADRLMSIRLGTAPGYEALRNRFRPPSANRNLKPKLKEI